MTAKFLAFVNNSFFLSENSQNFLPCNGSPIQGHKSRDDPDTRGIYSPGVISSQAAYS